MGLRNIWDMFKQWFFHTGISQQARLLQFLPPQFHPTAVMLWLFSKYWQGREAPVYSQPAVSRTSVAVTFVHSSFSWFPLHDPAAFLINPCLGFRGVHPRGVCLHAKAASPYLTSLCLTAFQGLNPDKACLDLSLLAHNQGAGDTTWATGVGGSVERRVDGRTGKDAGKVTPDRRPTRSFHSLPS